MPYRRRRRGYGKRPMRRGKRRMRKGRGGRGMLSRIARNPSMLVATPRTRLVNLRYADSVTLTSGGGIIPYYYLANGCNDPQVAAGGHQPLGFDQWGVFYQKYIVVGSLIRVRVCALSSLPGTSIIVGVRLTNNTSFAPAFNWTGLVEQGRSVWKDIQGITNGNVATLRLGYSTKKFFGISNVKDNLPLYSGNMGATQSDPTELAYFQLFMSAADQATGTAPAQFSFTIDYKVLLFEPRDIPQSN